MYVWRQEKRKCGEGESEFMVNKDFYLHIPWYKREMRTKTTDKKDISDGINFLWKQEVKLSDESKEGSSGSLSA